MVAVALARLDPVYRQVPGVYASWQLQPLALEARYELPWVWRGLRNETVEGEQRANRREARNVGDLTAALEPLSEDVVVHGWREGSSRTVAVGVAEVEQDAARLAEELLDALPRATTRAWAVGDRFVVALTVTAPGGPERSALADERAEQVGASVAVARVLWWEAISLGPFLLVLLLAGAVLIAWFLLYAIFQLLKVVVFLLVLLPLTLLGLREPRPSLPPAAQDDALRALAPGVVPVDLDELQLPSVPGAVAWFTALVLALAVAIPALATSLWTASLVWGALGAALALVWWGRGRNDPWARAARWAVAAAAALELANALFGLGPGLPADGPLALAAAAALLAGAVALAWRRTALSDSLPGYVPWHADLDPRAVAYLAGLAGIAVAGGALFLGSNGDLELSSQLVSKGLALAGLAVVPIVGRRVRAAREAARREWARDRQVPEVLLLRSFVDDGLKVPSRRKDRRGFEQLIPARRELFEDVVVRSLTRLGPVVAIARPGTGQTELGASRDLIIGPDWLTAVKAEMAEAAYIAVILGKGEGLSLELQTLRDLELLDRVCLVVPPVDPEDATERLARGTEEVEGEDGWGRLTSDRAGRPAYEVVALVGTRNGRYVVVSKARDATAYLRLGSFLATRLPRPRV
jgi:hypothetical protein